MIEQRHREKKFPEGRSSRHLENSGRVHLEKQVKNQVKNT